MEKSQSQTAKEFHMKLVEQGLIDDSYEGLLGDKVWVSKNGRASKLTDLADIHLENIVNKLKREEKELPESIWNELQRRVRERPDTRVFFVTDSLEDNEELHETLEQARAHLLSAMNSNTNRRIRVCLVRHAYKENERWNYDDYSDTFTEIKLMEEEI